MNLIRVGGEYRVKVIRAGLPVKDTGWMPNIVTNIGLDRLLSRTVNPTNICRVGTGSSTPVATNSALDSQIGSQGSASYASLNEGTPNYQTLITATYTFTLGAVVGNITELGVGATTSGADLFSRALILDGGGAPTTISVTAADQLIVVYRFRYYPPLTDNVVVVNLSGTNYTITGRVANIGTAGFASILNNVSTSLAELLGITNGSVRGTGSTLGAITASPTGGTLVSSATSDALVAYTTGTFFRDWTYTVSAASGNSTGGIKTLFLSGANTNGLDYQYDFNPILPKDATKQLVLTFRTTVARYP
jgi:hypothetical protein